MDKLNASDVLEQFRSKTKLSKKFLQCIPNTVGHQEFLNECARLALELGKLGIHLDGSQPFDEQVSVDILKQYEKLLCLVADSGHKDELLRLQQDQRKIDSLRPILEQLRLKKKQLDLKPADRIAKEEQIQKMIREKKLLERQIERTVRYQQQQMPADQMSLEGGFLQEELSKNQQLLEEIEELRRDIHGFEDFDLNVIDNDDDIGKFCDQILAKLEQRYNSYYSPSP